MTGQKPDDARDGALHRLGLRRQSKRRQSQPDRYDVDLVARASWESPYQVRMVYSGKGSDPGALSWEFPTEPAALRHIHLLVTRQQDLGYTLARIPRTHPYRAWLEARNASDEPRGEDDPQVTLF